MNNAFSNYTAAELAAKCINQTSKPVFLTGKAGTGKTTFLKNIIEHTHKNTIVVAPTGIAAINAGGVTIHSLFGIPFGLFIPDSNFKIESPQLKIHTPFTMVKHLNMRDQKRRLLQELELLIIDEVSMLRADLLDTIDFVLKNTRRQNHKPFGGVQVLFIGDLMQLPPVVKEEEWNVLRNYYNSVYFFDAQVLKNEKPVYIELDKIYRQSDNTFINLLNNLRNNKVTQADIDLLNNYYKPDFKSSSVLNIITLTTHNQKADTLNKSALAELKGNSYFFNAKIEGDFNEHAYPVEQCLELKINAQVMFIKNDPSGKQQFFNGKIGIISAINDKEIEVDFNDGSKPFLLELYQWNNIRYDLNELTHEIDENIIGTFLQFPIKLAWAITVHKSQGLTFEKAILDINRAFAPGQVYVALSRLKSLDGLVLTSPIQFTAISQDKLLVDYADKKPKTEEIKHLINSETVSFLKSYFLKSYDFVWLYTCLKNHVSSYTMTDKSNKQKHNDWAKELLDKFEPIKLNSEKFTVQLTQIFLNVDTDYLKILHTRHYAAKNYFYPILKELSKFILIHIELLKEEKQIKVYLEELLELEGLIYKHIQLLDKTSVVIDNILNNVEFDKRQLKMNANQNERLEIIRQTIAISHKVAFEERKTKKQIDKKNKEKLKKLSKPDTKEISFNLYKLGKTIEEISKERNLGISTVETHISHYVSLGLIPVTQFVNKDKLDAIIQCAKEFDSKLALIKQNLGDEYSYTEIKFAVASQKFLNNK